MPCSTETIAPFPVARCSRKLTYSGLREFVSVPDSDLHGGCSGAAPFRWRPTSFAKPTTPIGVTDLRSVTTVRIGIPQCGSLHCSSSARRRCLKLGRADLVGYAAATNAGDTTRTPKLAVFGLQPSGTATPSTESRGNSANRRWVHAQSGLRLF